MKITFNDKTYQVNGELTITELSPPEPLMELGINSNWGSTWDSPKYFVNLARNLGHWKGDKPLEQCYGKILECDPDTIYKATVLDKNAGINVKVGVYYIKWSGEGELSINGLNGPTYLHDGKSFIEVTFKGKHLNSLSIVHEDDLEQYALGNEWMPEYLEYFKTLNATTARAMNWLNTNKEYVSDWNDRVTVDDISFNMGVPLEVIIDFSNRMSVDLWYNVPPRASYTYIEKAAEALVMLQNNLFIELGNEIWNTAEPFGDGTAWIKNNGNTKLTASASSNMFKLEEHGLSSDDEITCYSSLYDAQNNLNINWRLKNGITCRVVTLSANTFMLLYDNKPVELTSDQTELLYSRNKLTTATLDEHYTWKTERIWSVFEQYITRDRMCFLLASQYNNPWHTEQRYKALSDKTNIDYIAIAPYYGVMPEQGDSFQDYAEREIHSFPLKILEHEIVDIPIICYEGGSHIHYKLDDKTEAWLYEYWKSQECEEVMIDYLAWLEENSIELFCYYKDASTTRFGLCADPNNPSIDGRYRGFIK